MVDELERAIRQRDLGLLAEPRSRGVQPRKPGLLDLPGGVTERLALLNQFLNPVEAIGQSMRAGERMMSPNMGGYDRLAALGDMLSGVAGVAGPAVAAGRAGIPAATAIIEGLLGGSPTTQAAGDMARQFAVDESGALRLFHGSPHDFDRFSMSKIGTGEGAQAYGPGLYFAENEGVARGYRDALSARAAPNDARGNAFDLVQRMGGDVEATAELLRDSIPATTSPNTEQFLRETLKHVEDRTYADFERPLGRMYEVSVNANPEDFLDWDNPLSQQPQAVRDFANARWQQIYGRDPDPSIEGEYIAKMATPQFGVDSSDWLLRGGPADDQRERLRAAGIPGIRYLDQGSRSFTPTTIKDTPRGSELYWGNDPNPVDVFPTRQAAEEAAKQFDTRSRNYVIFDENLIEIVRKYGLAGAAAMLGISQADVAQAMQQQQQPQTRGLLGVQ
jgi:hypothetical protein